MTTAIKTEALATADMERIWREHHRHLVGVAARMLVNAADAEDVVQEAFSRLMLVDLAEIDDVRAWMTVVVRRLCLNRLGSAYLRRESVAGATPPELQLSPSNGGIDPSDRVTLDDQVQAALALVLEELTPAERTSFVLHDVFSLPFIDIAAIVGRTPAACRQLASRGRRAIQTRAGSDQLGQGTVDEYGEVTRRFIAACSGGSIEDLLQVLDPDVDGVATRGSSTLNRTKGAHEVAAGAVRLLGPRSFTTLVPIPLDGAAGVAAISRGRVRAVLRLEVSDGVVSHIHAHVSSPKARTRV